MAGSLIALGRSSQDLPRHPWRCTLSKKNWEALLAGLITAFFGRWSQSRSLAGVFTKRITQSSRGRCGARCSIPITLPALPSPPCFQPPFIFEPQLNAHSVVACAMAFAVLHPAFQVSFCCCRHYWIDLVIITVRISLEWSALLGWRPHAHAIARSYHFTVLVLPVPFFAMPPAGAALGSVVIVIVLYLAVGYPGWNIGPADGWQRILT